MDARRYVANRSDEITDATTRVASTAELYLETFQAEAVHGDESPEVAQARSAMFAEIGVLRQVRRL